MSTLRTYNLQSIDSGSVNIQLSPNAGAIFTGLTTAQSGLNVTGGTILSGLTTAQSGLNITSGSVGIGTDNPARDLEISGTSANVPVIRLSDTDTALSDGELSSAIEFAQNDNSDPNSVNASIRAIGDGSVGNLALAFHTGQDIEKVRIVSSGNVGIGTDNPGAKLTVWADDGVTDRDVFRVRSKTGSFNIQVSDSDADNPEWSLRTYANEPIVFKQATTERLRIGSLGQIGIGGTNYGTNNQVITSTGTGTAPVWRGVNAAFYGYQGTAHNVAHQTWTVVKNLGGTGSPPPVNTTGWDSSTGLFTADANTAGTWYIFGCAGIDDIQTLDVVYMGIMINGANPSVYTHSRMYSGATNSIMGGGMVAAVVTLNDGDTVGVGVYHNEGTTQPTEQNRCFAGGFRLSV